MSLNVPLLAPGQPLPDPRHAGESGLVAVGGDLAPASLLDAYGKGIFPWYEDPPILWFSPDPRMALPPAELRISRSMKRVLNRGEFEVRLDTAFAQVIRACAVAPRTGQRGTWINSDMVSAYLDLHAEGYAHSCEAWHDGALAGGLYGVSLGGVFFGESMFTLQPNASKVAFVRLVEQLRDWRFELIDCQIHTPHMARFGAREYHRGAFLDALATGLESPTRRGCWSFDPGSNHPPTPPGGP